MVILAVLALVLGVLVGTFDVQNFLLDTLVSNKDLVLYLLMFSVGMSIGLHKGIIKKIKEYHVKILIIPAGIIVGTLLGGALLSMITKYNIGESTSGKWFGLVQPCRGYHRKSCRCTAWKYRLFE